MKKSYLVIIITALIFLGIGYGLGLLFPFKGSPTASSSSSPNQSAVPTAIPASKGELKVTVMGRDSKPMVGIEVDVATTLGGQPQSWGIVEADTNGVARYTLDPGSYYVYFNNNRFPSGYVIPQPQSVLVKLGETKELTIVLQTGSGK